MVLVLERPLVANPVINREGRGKQVNTTNLGRSNEEALRLNITTVCSRGDTLLLQDLHLRRVQENVYKNHSWVEQRRWKFIPLRITGHYSSTLDHITVQESPTQTASSCCRPAASSQSLDPTGRLCCPTQSPPRTPEAPAAAPSPSLPTHLSVRVVSNDNYLLCNLRKLQKY